MYICIYTYISIYMFKNRISKERKMSHHGGLTVTALCIKQLPSNEAALDIHFFIHYIEMIWSHVNHIRDRETEKT
jgi:hypothetical protein